MVVAPRAVVVHRALQRAAAEHEVDHPRVRRHHHLGLEVLRPGRGAHHLERPDARRGVLPAVESPRNVHLFREVEVGVGVVIVHGDLLTGVDNRGVGSDDVLLLPHRHQPRLALLLVLQQSPRCLPRPVLLRGAYSLPAQLHHPYRDPGVPILLRRVAPVHQQPVVVPVVVVPVILHLVRHHEVQGVRRAGHVHVSAPPVVVDVHHLTGNQLHLHVLLHPHRKLVETYVTADTPCAPEGVVRLVKHQICPLASHDRATRLDDVAAVLLHHPRRHVLPASSRVVPLLLAIPGGDPSVLLQDCTLLEQRNHLLPVVPVFHVYVEVLLVVVFVRIIRLEDKVEVVAEIGDVDGRVEPPRLVVSNGNHRGIKLVQGPVVKPADEPHVVLAAEDAAVRTVDEHFGWLIRHELGGHSEEQGVLRS
mmetsp:Transcript_41500/g.66553  ORF Transcript_41500/g.66553 Transcript_41500/m.66553 type:complete len:419 (+) Transcript_41500:1674-2930(+)